MLTSAELSAMRALADDALPGTAILQTSAYVSDGGGGGSYGWTAAGTVACRLGPIRGDEREIGERIAADADYILTLPGTVSVNTNQRAIVTGAGTFTFAAVRDRSWAVTQRVEVTKEV